MDYSAKEEKRNIREKIISLFVVIVFVIIFGTIVYSRLEGWDFVDSFYFSATLPTVGFGELQPATDAGKVFTVFFAFTGMAMMIYALALLGTHYIHYLDTHKPIIERRVKKVIKTMNPLGKKEDDWFVLKEPKKKE